MALKQRITDEMKAAMRAGEKSRLATIRLILSAIKQIEVDERIDPLPDDRVLATLDKMVKQRRESISQYEKAERHDLADQEKSELKIIQEYLPAALSEQEINTLIDDAIQSTGAASIKDMGKVMAIIKPQMQGRADMGKVSGQIKNRLNA